MKTSLNIVARLLHGRSMQRDRGAMVSAALPAHSSRAIDVDGSATNQQRQNKILRLSDGHYRKRTGWGRCQRKITHGRRCSDRQVERVAEGRALSSGEIIALMQACAADSSPAGARDAAIVAILYGCGLRRSELVTLDLAGLNIGSGGLTIRGGKGRKDREVYLPQGTIAAVADWVECAALNQGRCSVRLTKLDGSTFDA
jgi:integrase